MTQAPANAFGIGNNNSVLRLRTAQPDRRPHRGLPQPRTCEAAYLGHNHEIQHFQRAVPDIPAFTNAFSAIARGSLITCEHGPVAVEDLLPGDRVWTLDNGLQPLFWIGSMALERPSDTQTRPGLTRITADSFGMGRPMPDLVLGQAARLLRRDTALVNTLGSPKALAPVSAFADGETVLSIAPMARTRVYHLLFETHQIIRANGLEIESYHPEKSLRTSLSRELLLTFMDLFPHLVSLGGFGAIAYPRLSEDATLELLSA